MKSRFPAMGKHQKIPLHTIPYMLRLNAIVRLLQTRSVALHDKKVSSYVFRVSCH